MTSSLVIGPYRVIGEIARGGMAAVYAAEHMPSGRLVALKSLHSQFRGENEINARFLEEARLLAKLRHPNITEVHDILETQDRAVIVMELLVGSSLQRFHHEAGTPRHPGEVLATFLEICAAVKKTHEHALAHRDLKPSNVFLHCESNRVIPKLMDFGIAKLAAIGGEAVTRTGAFLGTPQYMAPEQFRDSSRVDARADIFALGVMMYEALTGQQPFQGDAVTEVMHRVVHEEVQPPALLNKDVSEPLEALVLKCLSKNRDQRYGSAQELIRALKDCADKFELKRIAVEKVPKGSWEKPPFDDSDKPSTDDCPTVIAPVSGEPTGTSSQPGDNGTNAAPTATPHRDDAPMAADHNRLIDEELPDYGISERIYQGNETEVFRGREIASRRAVMIKVLTSDYPTPDQIARLTHEYEILKDLAIDGVIRVLALKRFRNNRALVTEDFGAEALCDYISRATPDLAEILAIAGKIAVVLEQIHRRGVIHKDINPRNIVINPSTGEVKLIDFGLAMVQRGRQPSPDATASLEGTIAYISPEQTGRMNRAVDYRSDYYSLGVTLYELLTGAPPFAAQDRMELVHCHIAKRPRPPAEINPDIPGMVSDIVLKLMAKTAEDRYQSAKGLRADLDECRKQLRDSGVVTDFPPARYDVTDRFQISPLLYGREEQVAHLMEAFKRVRQGFQEFLVVAGFSGIGKTSLVNEIYKPVTHSRGSFITGKFDQYKRDIPYGAVIEAFQGLVKELLGQDETALARWRQALLEALGPNGRVITEVMPEVELVIGPQPEVPDLPPAEAHNRFNLVFQNLIGVFCRKEHPLVLFLDDLQWADNASINLIRTIMTRPDGRYLLIIGAYRDNEVDARHPLRMLLDELERVAAPVSSIELGPLRLEHVNLLVADTVLTSPEEALPLAELLHTRTQGNPFFLVEFLKSLHGRELLVFNHSRGRWQWDLDRIQELGLSDDVIDLMAGRIERLDTASRQALKLASCIGAHFPLHLLSQVTGKSPSEVMGHLKPAVDMGLVLLLGDGYKYLELDGDTMEDGLLDALLLRTVRYKFAHDRIQQAAYSLIPQKLRTTIHRQIGQILLRETPPSEREQQIFDIVNQLNSSIDLVDGVEDREELIRLNLLAGTRAKSSAAYASADNYFTTGINLLAENAWKTSYELTFELHTQAAEAAYLNMRFKKMERLIAVIDKHAKDPLDRSRAAEVQIAGYITQARNDEVMTTAKEMLSFLGINLPTRPGTAQIILAVLRTKLALIGKSPKNLVSHRAMTDERSLAAMRIMTRIASIAYVVTPNLFPVLVCRMTELSVRRGTAPSSPFAYALYGTILCGALGDVEQGYQFGKLGENLLDLLNIRDTRQRTTFTFAATTQHFKLPVSETLSRFLTGYRTSLEVGDFEYAANNSGLYMYHRFHSGAPLDELFDELAGYAEVMEQIKNRRYRRYFESYMQAIECLRGGAPDPRVLAGPIADGQELLAYYRSIPDQHGEFHINLLGTILQYLFGDPEKAVEASLNAERVWGSSLSMLPSLVWFFWDSLAHLALLADAPPRARRPLQRRVAKNQRKLARFARHAPSTHRHRLLLVQAELRRVTGRHSKAALLYDKAIEAARESGNACDHALANELAARAAQAAGRTVLARVYMTEAHFAWRNWGAVGLAERIEKEHGDLLMRAGADGFLATVMGTGSGSSSSSSSSSQGDRLDMNAVLKAATTLSSEIRLEQLLEKMMNLVIENGGAARGVLLLDESERLVIQAESRLEQDEVEILMGIPLSECRTLAQSVVNYVMRTHEPVVLDDASQTGAFMRDTYIQAERPRSILCMPLIHKNKLAGILYLENNLTAGAFTSDRLKLLSMLGSEIVVSLDNARLYGELEQYSRDLERKVRERTTKLSRANAALSQEKSKSDGLLLNVLPAKVVEDLKRHGHTEPEAFDSVTVFFSDFVDFTGIAATLSPQLLLKELNELFSGFDSIVEAHGCERIKTIGDAYLFVCGMPVPVREHARKAVAAAREIMAWLKTRNGNGGLRWEARMGLHSGPVVGGVVGVKKYIYDVFGDTINIASRMENHSEPMRINISETTWEMVKNDFDFTPRQSIEVKGKGPMRMYFVD